MSQIFNPFGTGGGGSGPIFTITGNDGTPESPIGNNFNFLTARSTVQFLGSPGTETLDFGISNLILGNKPASIGAPAVDNIGLGRSVLNALTNGELNVIIGGSSNLHLSTGSGNTTVGYGACTVNNGSNNVTIGAEAFTGNNSGSNTICIGAFAGAFSAGSSSNNIYIANPGLNTESNVMRIGEQGSGTGQINKSFVAGIVGNTISPSTSQGIVSIDTSGTSTGGQLAVIANSLLPRLIATQTASNSASISFTSFVNSGYKSYYLEILNTVGATGNQGLLMTVSTNNGSTYLNTGYAWGGIFNNASGEGNSPGSNNDTAFNLSDSLSNSLPGSYTIKFFNLNDAVNLPTYLAEFVGFDNSSGILQFLRMGGFATATQINALKFAMTSGNITSGTFNLYGII